MRFIDIAAASCYAILSLAVILVLNPGTASVQSLSIYDDSAAAAGLLSYLRAHDLHFLATATPTTICDSLSSWNNASVVVEVSLNHLGCGTVQDDHSYPGHFVLELHLQSREVELEGLAR